MHACWMAINRSMTRECGCSFGNIEQCPSSDQLHARWEMRLKNDDRSVATVSSHATFDGQRWMICWQRRGSAIGRLSKWTRLTHSVGQVSNNNGARWQFMISQLCRCALMNHSSTAQYSPVIDLQNRQARIVRQLFLLIFRRIRMLKIECISD